MASRHYQKDWVLLNHPEYKSGWRKPKPERVVKKPMYAPRDNAPGYISTDYRTLFGGARSNDPLEGEGDQEEDDDFYDAEADSDFFEAAATLTRMRDYTPPGTKIGEDIEKEPGPWQVVTYRKHPRPRVIAPQDPTPKKMTRQEALTAELRKQQSSMGSSSGKRRNVNDIREFNKYMDELRDDTPLAYLKGKGKAKYNMDDLD